MAFNLPELKQRFMKGSLGAVFCSVCSTLYDTFTVVLHYSPVLLHTSPSCTLMSVVSHSGCVAARDQRFILPFRQGEDPSRETSAPQLLQPTVYSTGKNEVRMSEDETWAVVLTVLNHSASLVNISFRL